MSVYHIFCTKCSVASRYFKSLFLKLLSLTRIFITYSALVYERGIQLTSLKCERRVNFVTEMLGIRHSILIVLRAESSP